MEPARPQSPPEISISTSPRSPSFFDRVIRRTFSGSGSHETSRIPTLNLPAGSEHNNTSINNNNATRSRPQSRSSSRSSHKRRAVSDMNITTTSSAMMTSVTSKSGHLTVETQSRTRSTSRSRSRSRSTRSASRSHSPNPGMDQSSRVASINHVGRHTNDWLFGGFHLTPKIGAPRGRGK
ncbi:hypothetical protein ABW19_dt0206630 [Dactylella cylindrospora]|nr:hypothetical protein ABW19_dt0206630 [Dactylella cylindrospora]